MSSNRRWLACWVVSAVWWNPLAAARLASPGDVGDTRAHVLHAEGVAARDLEQFSVAAERSEAAYDVLPPCSPGGPLLLEEADGAYRRAFDRAADPLKLCQDERMLSAALGDGSCEASRKAIGDLLRALRKFMLRERVVCPTVAPALRPIDDRVPTAIVERRQPPPAVARWVARPPARAQRGTAIAGAVLLGGGGAAVVSLAVAVWRGVQSERAVEQHLVDGTPGCVPETLTGDCQRLDRQGEAMNRLAIASGVLAGALVVSGVALLLVGRHQTSRGARPGAIGGLPGVAWRF